MIYLSWSLAKLTVHLVILATAYAGFMWRGKKQRAFISQVFAGLLLGTLYTAFDVGTRQQDLQRGSFDAPAPEQQERINRETMGRDDVNQNFQQSLEGVK